MTLGNRIKQLRLKKGYTQKELADVVCVSYQTISKWENDTNEPDIATLKSLAKLFDVTLDQLTGDDEIQTQATEKTNVVIQSQQSQINKELSAELEKMHESTVAQRNNKKDNHRSIRDDRTVLKWSIAAGIVSFIVTLVVCIIYRQTVGIGWIIALPIIIGYSALAEIYCIFTASWISDVFLEVASWSIKMPGIIFTFDLDGLKFLIAMKIFFWLLGIAIAIGVIVLAITITTFLSIFAFIPLIIYNK